MSARKDKGDRGERELVEALRALGVDVERSYGAGRPDDAGDLELAGVVAQVKAWTDPWAATLSALRWLWDSPAARDLYPVAFVKVPRRRRPFVVTMELEDWAEMYRAAMDR